MLNHAMSGREARAAKIANNLPMNRVPCGAPLNKRRMKDQQLKVTLRNRQEIDSARHLSWRHCPVVRCACRTNDERARESLSLFALPFFFSSSRATDVAGARLRPANTLQAILFYTSHIPTNKEIKTFMRLQLDRHFRVLYVHGKQRRIFMMVRRSWNSQTDFRAGRRLPNRAATKEQVNVS